MAPGVFDQFSTRGGIARRVRRAFLEPGRGLRPGRTRVGQLVLLYLAGWSLGMAEPPRRLHFPAFTVRIWSSARELPGLVVHDLAQTKDGYLWAATRGGLRRNNSREFNPVPLPLPDVEGDSQPVRLHASPLGDLWTATGDRKIFQIGAGEPTQWELPDLPGLEGQRCFTTAPDGILWLTAGEWLFRKDQAGFTPVARSDGEPMRRCACAPDGRLWVVGAGVLKVLSRQTLDRAPDRPLPPQTDLRDLTWTSDGTLWLAFDQGGVAQVIPTPARWFNPLSPAERARRGLSAAGDAAVVADRDGTVWLANSWGGLAYVGRDERWTPIRKHAAPDGETARLRGDFRVLTPARSGGIWAGTTDGQLYRVTTGGAVRIGKNLPPGEGRIHALHEDHSGHLAVARVHGNAFYLDTAGAAAGTDIAGLPGGQVRRFFTTQDGTLWAGGDQVWRIADGSATPVPVRRWAGALEVVGFYENTHGDFWVASRRAGLCWLRQGVFEPLAPATSRIDGPLAGPEQDRDGRFWVVTRAGLWWAGAAAWGIRGQTAPATLPMQGVALPVPSQPWTLDPAGTPTLACDARGVVWLATTLGAMLIDPAALTTNARPPIVHITGARANGLPVPEMNQIVLAANTKCLEVDFDALAFVQPETVRVLARLGGSETPWRDVTGTRTVVWDQPPPGQHELQLRAFFDHQEHRASTAVLPWRQRQPWWRQRTLSVIFAGVLLGALCFHLWMTRRAVWELGPDRRSSATLAQALEADAQRLIGKSVVGLDWSAAGPAWPVSAETAIELRRIQNEAVTNALKHAEASEITIRLAWLPTSLTLEIRDDGRGFDPIDAQASGTLRLGLQGMQARAKLGARNRSEVVRRAFQRGLL